MPTEAYESEHFKHFLYHVYFSLCNYTTQLGHYSLRIAIMCTMYSMQNLL